MTLWIQKNPHETILVPVPREARIDISLNLQSTFSSIACRLLINQNYISFHKASKDRGPPFILGYCSFHTGRFGNPGLTKVHLLYFPKNTALSTPRHVGKSAHLHMC
ncbi:hypothetical protein AVEN_221723-1 [Araneus ventricosus]|uniref:Uncharacterized protein n=1 Tax=Araneus ventricosus TaxID=182803 RepID=A0A4Y2QR50_ARAVE|nr:hypothetical protein AVEN_221723-1 [Araneus ventricosus]